MRWRSRCLLQRKLIWGSPGGLDPTPPDKDMGDLEGSISDVERGCDGAESFVASKLDAEYKTAELTISGELRNGF